MSYNRTLRVVPPRWKFHGKGGDRHHGHASCGFGILGSLPAGHQLQPDMNISDFQHLTWYKCREVGFFSLLILHYVWKPQLRLGICSVEFRSVVLLWDFGAENPALRIRSQLPILHWCVSKGKKPNPRACWLSCSQKPVFPLPQWPVPPGGKSSKASQGFPLNEQHKMNMKGKKKKNFGMLWNP